MKVFFKNSHTYLSSYEKCRYNIIDTVRIRLGKLFKQNSFKLGMKTTLNNSAETTYCRNAVKVLLVDDEPFVLKATKNFFEKTYCNIEINCAQNGSEAIKIASDYIPDLIVLDFNMPEMNGLEVLDFIKNNKKTSKTRVITISSFYDKLEDMLFYGSDAVLEKPFSSHILSSAIGQIMPQIKVRQKGHVQ